MDLVAGVEKFPETGQTIFGKSFERFPGGKGANQAVMLGKLGAPVEFLGALGNDSFAQELHQHLSHNNVGTENLITTENSTGTALITVDSKGENQIIVIPGANYDLIPDNLPDLDPILKNSRALLLQLEIPLETISFIINKAKKFDTEIILDPAPSQELPEEILKKVDYLLPNEGELRQLLPLYKNNTAKELSQKLLEKGVKNVLLTRGEKGVSLFNADGEKHFSAFKVKAVDTTAAGDAFAGAFAYGLYQGWPAEKCISFASATAAISVTRSGAQVSLPTGKEIQKFAREHGLSF